MTVRVDDSGVIQYAIQELFLCYSTGTYLLELQGTRVYEQNHLSVRGLNRTALSLQYFYVDMTRKMSFLNLAKELNF